MMPFFSTVFAGGQRCCPVSSGSHCPGAVPGATPTPVDGSWRTNPTGSPPDALFE